jgi:hypothetical protein
MSCKACQDFQKTNDTSYLRWKNATIEIRGCHQHVREILEVVRLSVDVAHNREATKHSVELISESQCFLIPFFQSVDEVQDNPTALMQLAAAVYLDKPIVLLVPEGKQIPKNLHRMAEVVEYFTEDNQESWKAASLRAIEQLRQKGIYPL